MSTSKACGQETAELRPSSADDTSEYQFSIAPEECGVAGVALLSLKEMFKQAGRILKNDAIVTI